MNGTINSMYKVNHLLFMDDLKLFAKLIDLLRQFIKCSAKILGWDFGLKKCGVLVLKRGKVVEVDGVTFPDGQAMKQIDKDGYRYLGILESDSVKEGEMKIQC